MAAAAWTTRTTKASTNKVALLASYVPAGGMSHDDDDKQRKIRVPKGYLPIVLVRDDDDEGAAGTMETRVLVRVSDLKEPCMAALLEAAEEQFGYGQQGVLKVPCDEQRFHHVVSMALNSNSRCGQCSAGVDPTLGFIAVNLTEDRFKLHHPYDLPPEQRYEFRDGVRRMWVYCTDKPFSRGSPTKPRSEILLNATYTTGVWQFEGYGYVPAGTSGVSVMQVFGASGQNTTLRLHVHGGRLMYYNDEARVVDASIYDRWFRLNVVHDVIEGALTVFVDGEERLAVAGHGGYRHYFKFGVYTQRDPSHYMESRWRDVKVYTKLG